MQSRFLALLLSVLFAPVLGFAQTWMHTDRIGTPSNRVMPGEPNHAAGYTVSVRDLSIPEKAHKSFQKGTRLLVGGNAAASIPEFKRAIADFHSYYEAYYQLGAAQFAVGQVQDAAAAFSKSIETSDGRFAEPYFALTMILCRQSKFAEGDTMAKIGLSIDPDSLNGQLSLSWAELGLGRPAVAEKTVREVLQHKPDFLEARRLLLELHRQQNNLPALVEDIEAYLKLDSSSAISAQLRTLRENALRSLAQQPENKTAVVASAQQP